LHFENLLLQPTGTALNSFGRGTPRDHSCEVWSKSNEWIQRRSCLKKLLTHERTDARRDGRWATDNGPSEKFNLSTFCSCELKKHISSLSIKLNKLTYIRPFLAAWPLDIFYISILILSLTGWTWACNHKYLCIFVNHYKVETQVGSWNWRMREADKITWSRNDRSVLCQNLAGSPWCNYNLHTLFVHYVRIVVHFF